ncbi:MAG: glycosyltransferase family 39 protein [Candidatus Omnitrophica bacterium]|nr:glycosyltransferase family 39 protein [Candidatus Omnitrophota bacterium]MBU1851545.1 glycosyltransferase family 39 protein [Candidatus Omnitrophota bacterium]
MINIRVFKDAAVLCVLVAIFIVLTITSAMVKSPTSDEVAHHIPAGYVFLTKGDIAYATDSPVLARYLAGFPLLFMDIELPAERSFWARPDRAKFSREFMYELNRPLAGKMVLYARMNMILLGAAGGVFLFFWMRKHYGPGAALLSAFFFFMSPNIMAHARLATTDIASTVFIMCSVLSYWDLIVAPSRGRAAAAGIFFGLALMSKYSALLLLPVYSLAMLWAAFRPANRKKDVFLGFLLFLIIAIVVLWAGNGFELKPFLADVLRAGEKELIFRNMIRSVFPFVGDASLARITDMLYTAPVPLSSYILGALGVLKHGAGGAATFFMGKWSARGHPLYYALAFLIKTPVAIILSFFIGMFTIVKGKRPEREFKMYLLFVIVMFFVVASSANLQLGLRYVLPVYPLMFIISAFGVKLFFDKTRLFRLGAAAIILWMLAAQLFIWPDYLSYFNELCGGPSKGYRYLRDSNLDWGQDLPALKSFMAANNIDSVKLDYFGEADPAYYGIGYQGISEAEQETPAFAVYAISANHLDNYRWAAGAKPDAYAGGSIYIYDFTKRR